MVSPQILCVTDGGWGDVATNFSAFFRHRDIAEYARALGFIVIELREKDANRLLFESALRATEPTVYVGHMGHGDETRTAGFNNEILLDPSNWQITGGRVCIWNTCTFGKSYASRLGVGELAEVSYNDLLWISVENQSDPANDTVAPKYFRCFHAVERGILEDKAFDVACTEQVATYQREIDAAPPIDKYYLTADLGALVQQVKAKEYWKWRIRGGQPPTDKLLLYIDGQVAHEWAWIGAGKYVWSIAIMLVGIHELKAQKPDGKTAIVHIEIVEGEELRFNKPTEGQKFTPGQTIPIEVEVI